MTNEQVKPLLDHIIAEYKKYEVKKKSDKFYIPDFYPTYRACVEMEMRLRIHSDYDAFPEKLFKEKAPNELPHEFNYRKNIYKPITVPYFHKAVNIAGRVWNRQNYEMRFDDASEERYFTEDYPRFGSLENYFQQIVSFMTLTDPNAVLAIMPANLQYFEDGTFNDTVETTPVAHCFHSKRVWAWKENEYAIIKADYGSEVENGRTKTDDGLVFFIFDKNEIQIAKQVGKKADYTFEIELYYKHDMNKLPCTRLGGISVQEQGDYYFQSFYTPAIPALDQAVCDFSTLQMSKYSHAFLQKWEYVDECDKCSGSGYTEEALGFEEKVAIACSNCGGSGTKRMFGPMSVYQVQTPNRFTSEVETKVNIPPAGFIELDPQILEFLNKQVITNIQMAFELLSIDVMNNEKISGRETATGKAIDREELYSFLLRFANTVFHDFEFAIKTIGEMRYGADFAMPAIRYPQNFEMRTDAELTAEIEKAPTFSKAMLAQQYLDTRFPIQEEKSAIMKLAVQADPLFNLETKDVLALVSTGLVPKWKAILHFELESLIKTAIAQNDNFFELTLEEQKEALATLAKTLVPAEEAPRTMTPQSVMNARTAVPAEEEEEEEEEDEEEEEEEETT